MYDRPVEKKIFTLAADNMRLNMRTSDPNSLTIEQLNVITSRINDNLNIQYTPLSTLPPPLMESPSTRREIL